MIGNPVECYLTTADGASKLQQQPTIYFDKQRTTNDVPPYCILFLSGIQFQQMDGFGGSFTDFSSYLILKVLSESSRQQLMQSLFSKTNGIQLGFIRQPMGATDFSRMGNAYTYDETEGDSSLSNFSINKDKENIIPCLQLAKQMNPQLLVMLTPWSVPSWCKTNNSILGTTNVEAHLKPECYPIVANYFIKTIQAYSSVGIPIYAMTVQNEPLYAPTNYAGCIMTSQEQINFISNYLGPLMKQSSISTKLLCFDHNFDHAEYPLQVLSDGKANAFVSGTAFHPYTTEAGHDVMSMVHDAFPDKEMYLTEASGGNWIPQWESAFLDQMQHMIRAPRNWCKAVVCITPSKTLVFSHFEHSYIGILHWILMEALVSSITRAIVEVLLLLTHKPNKSNTMWITIQWVI